MSRKKEFCPKTSIYLEDMLHIHLITVSHKLYKSLKIQTDIIKQSSRGLVASQSHSDMIIGAGRGVGMGDMD